MVSREELEALKVAELKVKLKDATLPVSGTKAVLVNRLLEHYEALAEEKAVAAEDEKPVEEGSPDEKDSEEKGSNGDNKEGIEEKKSNDDNKESIEEKKSNDGNKEGIEEKKSNDGNKESIEEKEPQQKAAALVSETTDKNEVTTPPVPSSTISKASPSAREEDANSCVVEAGSSAAAMSAVEGSGGEESPGKGREGEEKEEDVDMESDKESPESRREGEEEDAAAASVIQTKSGKAIPKIRWDQAGGEGSPVAGGGGRSPGSRKRLLSGGDEDDDDHKRKVERARRFGTEEGRDMPEGSGEKEREEGVELKKQSEVAGQQGERKREETLPMAKSMEKFAEFVDRVMHDAQLITAEDVLAEERNAAILDLALEQLSKENVMEMMLDIDRDIKREFRWRTEIRWPPSMFHGRFRRACRMAGLRGMPDDRFGGYSGGKGSWGKGGRWGEGDRMEGSWGGRSGSSRGRAAYFGHDDRAGIREPSPPLEGMDRVSSPTRPRGRPFGSGKGDDSNSGGFRPRQSWGRGESGGGAVWQHDDRAGGRSFEPTNETPGRRDERRGFRSRSRSPLPPMQSNLPSELKNIVEDFIRDNRLDERAASALLQRTTPDVLVRVLEMGRLTGPNHSRELMLRLRDIGGGGFRRSGGSPFSGGRRRPFSPPPSSSRRRSRSRSEGRSRRPSSPPAYRRPHRGRHGNSRSGSRERNEHSSSRRHSRYDRSRSR